LTPDTGSQPDLPAEISSLNFAGLINCSNLIIRDLKEFSAHVPFFRLQFNLFSPGRNLEPDVFEGLITTLFVGSTSSLSLTLTCTKWLVEMDFLGVEENGEGENGEGENGE